MPKMCYILHIMKIEFNADEFKYIKELEDITADSKKHQAICGYIGGGSQDIYADVDLGADFIKALTIYANKHDLSLQRAIRLVIDGFLSDFIKNNSDGGDSNAYTA